GAMVSLGRPPTDPTSDWVILVRPADAGRVRPSPPPEPVAASPAGSKKVPGHPVLEDAYLENGVGHNSSHLKVEPGRRVAYLKVDLSHSPVGAIGATLELTAHGDPGRGTLLVHRAAGNSWSEKNLNPDNAPASGAVIGRHRGPVGDGETITIDVTSLLGGQKTESLVLSMEAGGNDIWFSSKTGPHPPRLLFVTEDAAPNLR
ncbi:MAG: DNRLRE domain-containing protein, partial [Verrucomicrobiota bacterium]